MNPKSRRACRPRTGPIIPKEEFLRMLTFILDGLKTLGLPESTVYRMTTHQAVDFVKRKLSGSPDIQHRM